MKIITPKYSALVAILLACGLSSCVDRDYKLLGDINTDVATDLTLVAPVAQSHLNLLEALPDSFGNFRFVCENNEVYLEKKTSYDFGNDITGHLKMYPQQKVSQSVSLHPDAGNNKHATFNEQLSYVFSNINTNPNERLDSILYASSQVIELQGTSPVEALDGSYVNLQFDANELLLNPTVYPGNAIKVQFMGSTWTGSVDLSGATIKFKGGNTFHAVATGEVLASTAITEGQQVSFVVDFSQVKPRVTYGYLGPNRILSEQTKVIPFEYKRSLEGSEFFLPFTNPKVYFDTYNTIGIPVRYNISYVKAFEKATGATVYAEFNGSQSTWFMIDYPKYDLIKSWSHNQLLSCNVDELRQETHFVLDKDNGRTDRLFTIKPDSLEYHYQIQSTAQAGEIAYFFDESHLYSDVIFRFSAQFNGNADSSKNFFIQMSDTVKLDLSSAKIEDESIKVDANTRVVVRLRYTNHLPVGAKGVITFADSNYVQVMPELRQQATIAGAPVGADGVVTQATAETVVYVHLTYDQYNRLAQNCKYMLMNYRVANQDLHDIWFKSNDWLDLQGNVYLEGKVGYSKQTDK